MPTDERRRERWQRLWLERRAPSGATPAEAMAALQSPSLRALLAVLDRQADAAIVDAAEPAAAAAWRWLEPRPQQLCAELWLAGDPAANRDELGWWEANAADPVSVAAEKLRSAVAEMARLTDRPALAAVVSLVGAGVTRRPPGDRFTATLVARAPALAVSVYSPLLFREGRLQAAALLAEIRRRTGVSTPVIFAPQLERAEMDPWSGPLLAGAEIAVARLRPDASATAAQATCAWLQRWPAVG